MNITKINQNTFQANGDIFTLTSDMMDFLLKEAGSHKLQRARINIHHSNDDPIHEMIIAFTDKSKVHPHSHPGKIESFHIIHGQIKIRFFDDTGKCDDSLTVSLDAVKGPFYYRLQTCLYHEVIPMTEHCIIHEITNGPFEPGKSSVFPKWGGAN